MTRGESDKNTRLHPYLIQLPSAFPPPCPLVLLEHRWPAALGDNSVLCLELCRPKMAKNDTECWLFLHFLFYALRHVWGRNITKTWSKSSKKEAKMEAWGGSGDSWGSSWRHLGPNTAPSSKKLEKVSPSTPPGTPRATLKSSESHQSAKKEDEKRT